jgi:hypothetical protein
MAKASEEYKTLLEYVKAKPHGAVLDYQDVQTDTSIKMDTAGRSKLRQAIIKSGHEYQVFPGIGYELAKAQSVAPIQRRHNRRFVNAGRRAARSVKILYAEFKDEIDADTGDLLHVTSGFLQVMIKESNKIETKQEIKKLNMPSEPDIKIV